MPDVLIDVRFLQHPGSATAAQVQAGLALLQQAPDLDGQVLTGLTDPALPALPPGIRALLHRTRTTAYTGAMLRPLCLVQPAPLAHDPLFVARLLDHPAIPSIALHQPGSDDGPRSRRQRVAQETQRRWLARHGALHPDIPGFWPAVAAMRPALPPARPLQARPRLALLTPLPPDGSDAAQHGAALAPALARHAEVQVFTSTPDPDRAWDARPLSRVPLLSAGFDRVVTVISDSPHHAPLLAQVLRFGGSCILCGDGLLALYHATAGPARTARLAEAELGRALAPEEMALWREGAAWPGARLLSGLAQAAEPLITSFPTAAGLAQYLPPALPPPPAPVDRQGARTRLGLPSEALVLAGFGPAADALWALYMLRLWGLPAHLALVAPPDRLAQAATLGLSTHVTLLGAHQRRDLVQAADIGLHLRSPGSGRGLAALAACLSAALPCAASESLASAFGQPGLLRAVPDSPGPVILAEAVAALAQAAARPAPIRSYDTYADELCTLLGLG